MRLILDDLKPPAAELKLSFADNMNLITPLASCQWLMDSNAHQ